MDDALHILHSLLAGEVEAEALADERAVADAAPVVPRPQVEVHQVEERHEQLGACEGGGVEG